jgi:hypothetical protein
VAGVAVGAVVDIIPNFSVLIVHSGLVVCVTSRAGEHRVIRRIHMAVVAGCPPALMGPGVDRECVVAECSSHPGRRRMTQRAIGRKSGSYVVWICDRLILALMAGVAVSGCSRVPPAHVTTGTWGRDVRASKGKCRLAMVKAGRSPCSGRMTNFALLRKPCGLMVGIGRVVVIGKVTRHAGRAQPRIVPVHMARLTTDLEMCARQRKRCA